MPRGTTFSGIAAARNKEVAAHSSLWLGIVCRNCLCSSRRSELLLDLSGEPDWGRDHLLADRSSVAAGETTVDFEVRALRFLIFKQVNVPAVDGERTVMYELSSEATRGIVW